MLLVGSGVPDEFDRRPERRYIGPMHWMTLVCDGAVLADRLRARPGWRAVTEDRIAIMQRFNQHLRDRPDLALIDTTTREIPDTVDEVLTWIRTTQRRCGGTELESVAHGT